MRLKTLTLTAALAAAAGVFAACGGDMNTNNTRANNANLGNVNANMRSNTVTNLGANNANVGGVVVNSNTNTNMRTNTNTNMNTRTNTNTNRP